MGIIIRQSFKTLVITYIGLFLGYVNNLWLYPLLLSKEEIGLVRILISVSFFFASLASLGTMNIPNRYFPYFNDKKNQNHGFLFFLIVVSFTGFVLFTLIFLGFKELIFHIYSENAPLLLEYFYYFIPLSLVLLFISVFKSYLVIQQKPVTPNFVNEILIRSLILVGLIFYFYHFFGFKGFVNYLVLAYLVCFLFLFIYTNSLGLLFLKPNFSVFRSDHIKGILVFGGFTLLGSASSILIINIDSLMLSAYKGLGQTGIYTIAFFIATVIEIPKRSLSQSVIPMVSEANRNNNISLLESLYKKSSINQLIIGALIFIGIWINIENIFHLMPHSEIYIQGKWVVFFIGLSKLFDMTTGINGEILGTSHYYKFDFGFLVGLGLLSVITNLLLIPVYGMSGAAAASLISVFIFNSARFIFIRIKMKIQPFTFNTIKVLVIILITLLINYFIPVQSALILDIILRSLIIFLIFSILTIITKSSEDVDIILRKLIKFIGNRLPK